MALHSTAKKRIVILISVVVVICFTLGGVWIFRQNQYQKSVRDSLAEGITYFDKGEYRNAQPFLEKYARSEPNDFETMYKLSEVYENVPQPGNRNISAAMIALRSVVDLNIAYKDASHKLLNYYLQLQQNDEGLNLIREILAYNPDDTKALKGQAIIDARLRRFDDALTSVNKVLAAEPNDYEMELLKVTIQRELNIPKIQLIKEAEELAAKHPDDSRYDLILSFAFQAAQNRNKSLEYLRKAANNPAKDPLYITQLIQSLDTAGQYPLSLEVLEKTVSELDSDGLKERLITRLMEHSRYADALELIGDIDPSSESTNLRYISYQVIAYELTNEKDKAQTDIDALLGRKNNAPAVALGEALQAQFSTDRDNTTVISANEAAIKQLPSFAYLYMFLGNAYAQSGNTEKAIEAWQNATKLRPNWAQPFAQLALSSLNERKYQEARTLATAAVQRDPANPGIAATWALTTATTLKPGQNQQIDEVLNVVTELEERGIQSEQLLLLKLTLLEKANKKDEAKTVIEDALINNNNLNQSTFLSLANISRNMKLGIEDQIYKKSQELYGDTPQLALSRANDLAIQGNIEDGLNELEKAKNLNATEETNVDWDIAYATYLRLTNDPRTFDTWKNLANQYQNNTRVQQLALRALENDPKAIAISQEIVDRLAKEEGEDNSAVQIERAKLLLNENNPSRNPEEAILLLEKVIAEFPTNIEPRLLIARAYEETGRTPLSMRELSNISKTNPDNPAISLELAKLYQSAKAFGSASEHLDHVAKSTTASPNQLRTAARMYAAQGENSLALSILEKIRSTEEQPEEQDLLLSAELYKQANNNDKLQPLIIEMRNNPTPRALAWIADYYASTDNTEESEKIVEQLKAMDLPAGLQEQLLSTYAAKHQNSNQALSYAIQRTEKQPENPDAWKQLIAQYISLNDGEDAINAAKSGLQNIPNQVSLQAIVDNQDAVMRITNQSLYTPIVLGLLGDAENRKVSEQVLVELARAEQTKEKAVDFANAIRPIAEKHQDVLPIQNLIAEIYLRTGHYEQAIDVSSKAMTSFPRAATPARISTDAHMALAEWNDAIIDADQWIKRDPEAKINADLRIATAQLQLKQSYNAIRTLKPYIADAEQQPNEFPEIVTLYGQALAIDNRIDEAKRFYQPLFEKSPAWRVVAMQSAVQATKNPQKIANWLNDIGNNIPATELDQKAVLADSLWIIGNRFDMEPAKQQAIQLIDTVVGEPEAPANAWFVRGVINETIGNTNTAIESYRETIKLNPELSAAKNNLAFILAQQPGANNEAKALAEEAVNASPSNPSFLDTLATVQSTNGEYAEAIETQKQAITLDPNNPLWRVNLLHIYEKAGMTQQAIQLRQQLESSGIQIPKQAADIAS